MGINMKMLIMFLVAVGAGIPVYGSEFHVATNGSDVDPGTKKMPFRTIQQAANLAQPGDIITVHKGVYRERINPPRGGTSDRKRIVYQAAPGEKVEIKGSEVVKNWVKVQGNVWKTTLPNSFFGKFNPYADLIHGDWFDPRGREHHTGAVYLDGDWLTEATKLDDVLKPADEAKQPGQYLLNVAWIRLKSSTSRIAADRFAEQQGLNTASCSEGGRCIGWIEEGDWVRYDGVDFGKKTESLEIRVASQAGGCKIELREGSPTGELIGTMLVTDTGDWQAWASFNAKIKPMSGVKSLCLVFKSNRPGLWFGQVDKDSTTIWAQFKDVDPNDGSVEINVRRTVFYPEKTGINYLTVRGFRMSQAATQWAPPTAEQVGLIGTHWSKGWIIENNDISYSICSGIALGKYGDEWDNTSATAEGYIGTINRALAKGWNKETIGHHIVRNNTISHCEQTGIVGSLGAVFSTITGNDIHDIHTRGQFSGAEIAGIKFHAAIDVRISGNHIYRACRGIWLDWMAQGAQVTGNLFHDNPVDDLFFEVNHGPYLVANNICLSRTSITNWSHGGAFAHNLFAGTLVVMPPDQRETPFHKAHSTEVVGLHSDPRGDDRYYNNLIVGQWDSSPYDDTKLPVWMGGNVFLNGARPFKHETGPLLKPEFNPALNLVEKAGGFYLELTLDNAGRNECGCKLVTTELFGRAIVPNVPYENPDGSPLRLNTDYFGKKRNEANPFPGPFEITSGGRQTFKVWPVGSPVPVP